MPLTADDVTATRAEISDRERGVLLALLERITATNDADTAATYAQAYGLVKAAHVEVPH